MNEEQETTGQVKIGDVIFITLRHWPWIIASVIVCVGIALAYVLTAQPSYTRSSQIVIKDDSKGKSIGSQIDFADMGIVATNTNILDEINKIQSPDVMREVVRRLNLEMNYSVPGTFHRDVVYGATLPIEVSLPSLLEDEGASLTVNVTKNGDVTLTDLVRDDEKIDFRQQKPFKLGETLNTPIGAVKVSKSDYYKPGEDYTVYVSRSPLTGTIQAYRKKLGVALQNQKANTIELTSTDKTIQRAEDLINTVIDVYNENWIENKNEISVATNNFINERLATIERELGNVDSDISSYQSAHLVPDVQQAAAMYMSEDQKANDQILQINNQLQMSRFMRQYLTDATHRNEVLPANSGIGNAAIEKQIADYNAKLMERNRLADNSSETHPVVMDLDAEIAGMRGAIISSIDNEIVGLNTQMRNVQGVKGRAQAQIANNPTQANYLLSVERQQKVKESLYLFLLQKREENELSQAFTAYNTQVIAKPYGQNRPVAPRKAIILGVAFIIGLALPFGVTFLREMLNTKVRGKKDIEGLTMPFLGEIPLWKPRMSKKQKEEREAAGIHERVVVEEGNRNVVNDAFRVLRTNIGFMTSGDKSQGGTAIMVTSVNAGSGKSYICVNLAISLALRKKRVILIDADLRHGSTSEVVGQPKKGVSDYLAGREADWHSVVVKDRLHKGADVLPVGQFPPNPTELLEGERFARLIGELRKEYDVILIDCPPIEMMADAQIVEKLVDRCIFVLRVGLLDRAMLPEVEKLYKEKKFRNMSVILNGTVSDGKYGYKYGYGYGYHYGYHYGGYGNDKE